MAGLQAQVALGDPRPDNNKLTDYYNDVDAYLPYRISKNKGEDVWVIVVKIFSLQSKNFLNQENDEE